MMKWRSRLCSAVLIVCAVVARAQAEVDTTQSSDPAPTLVTLHAANDTLSNIVAKIATQTGMPLVARVGNPSPPISLDVDNEPFWKVLDALCTRTNSTVMPEWNGKAQLMIQSGSGQPGQRIISGPVMMSFQSIQHVVQLTAPPDRQDSCEVTGDVMWEPRLNVLFADGWTVPIVAEDENGLSLVPDAASAELDPRGFFQGQSDFGRFKRRFNGNERFHSALQIRLHVPATAGRKLKNLSGQWRLFVPGKTDHFDIPSIVAAAKKPGTYNFGELGSIKLAYASSSDQTVQMQFNIPNGANGSNHLSDEMAKRNCLLQAMHARVLDADGALWGETATTGNGSGGQVNVGSGGNQTDVSVYIQRNAAAKGKPVKMTIEGPVTATEIDAAYSLHDLPLP